MDIKDLKPGNPESMTTIVVPGLFAIFPWVIFLCQINSRCNAFIQSKETISALLIFASAIAMGRVLEDIGCKIEHNFDRRQRRTLDREHFQKLDRYWKLRYQGEPMGHKYLTAVQLRLKFELSFSLAMVPFALGFLAVNITQPTCSGWIAYACVLVGVSGLTWFLMTEAYRSSVSIGSLRELLLDLAEEESQSSGTAVGHDK